MTEQNVVRERLLNSLMNVPHREIGPLVETYAQSLKDDPFFASKFLAWTVDKSQIRDQQDAAIVALLQSDNLEYRDAGEIYLCGSEVTPSNPNNIGALPPFRILRIAKYLATTKKPGKRRLSKENGIFSRYLHLLQVNHGRFDGVVMGNRKALKWLYKWSHFKPSPYAQAVLFEEKPPEGSKLAILKEIAKETDNRKRAELIMTHRIDFKTAQGLLDKFDPASAIALIEVMTPTQALNSQAMVERSGILQMEEVKQVYLDKIRKADKSAASARNRKSAQTSNAELQEATKQAQQASVDKKKKITQPLALLVDRSGSLSQAIQVSKEFCFHIMARLDPETPRKVVLFDDYAADLQIKDWSVAGIEKAFAPVKTGGYTSMEAAVLKLVKDGFQTSQLTFITDGQENVGNAAGYIRQWNPGMVVNIIQVGGYDRKFENNLKREGIRVNSIPFFRRLLRF